MWSALGARRADDALYAQLTSCYAEPHRRYHTMQHLAECMDRFEELRVIAIRPAEAELAVWFHDAIYDPRRNDNEALSAAWARRSALDSGVPDAAADRVHAMVLATRHEATPQAHDECIVVDVDLAILGAPTARFAEYEQQVREEYAWVVDSVFRRERRRLLESLLGRPTVFNTRPFIERYEAQARSNLEWSIRRLMA